MKSVGSIRIANQAVFGDEWRPTSFFCSDELNAGPSEKSKCTTVDIIQIEKHGIVCVSVKGKTTAELTPEFAEVAKQIIEGDKRRLLIDLGGLEYLKSSLLRVILTAVKEIEQKRGKVAICCLNGYAKEIFEANCLNNSIPITESVESGLNVLLEPLKAA
jgi:anti-anti-sigma factor